MQGSPANYVSPLIHDKPIGESFYPDQGEEYVNEHTAQNDEQSAIGQGYKQNLSWTRPTATDVPSTSLSNPLPVSPAWGDSCEDVIMNEPSTPGTSISEHIGHTSCIDCH